MASEAENMLIENASMNDMKTIVVQIQGVSKPVVARSAHSLMSCVAFFVPGEDWSADADDIENWCNVQIRSRKPAALWGEIYALMSQEPSSLRVLESCWIVVCEGRRAWDDYKTLAHFDDRKGFEGGS